MEISTKFNLLDKVWFYLEGKPTRGTIKRIQINAYGISVFVDYEIDTLEYGYVTLYDRHETQIFPSKATLLLAGDKRNVSSFS